MKVIKYIILYLVPVPEPYRVINYDSGSGSDFMTSYGSSSGSGSTSQKVTVPTVPVPQRRRLRGFKKGEQSPKS
jgi:hypothetical protein